MAEQRKTPKELAAFMYGLLRGSKLTTTEACCRRMQNYNSEVFTNLCDLLGSTHDYETCAQMLHELPRRVR